MSKLSGFIQTAPGKAATGRELDATIAMRGKTLNNPVPFLGAVKRATPGRLVTIQHCRRTLQHEMAGAFDIQLYKSWRSIGMLRAESIQCDDIDFNVVGLSPETAFVFRCCSKPMNA